VIGKTGKVVAVDSDGDLRVDFGGKTWLLNPQSCVPVSQGQGRVPSARASVTVNADSSDDDDNDGDDNSESNCIQSCICRAAFTCWGGPGLTI